MYSDRQKELKAFLGQLQQSVEEKTGEKARGHSVTKTDGKEILEIVTGGSPLYSPVIYVDESCISYGRAGLEEALQGIWAVYDRFRELEGRKFPFDEVRENIHLRFVHYERNRNLLKKQVWSRFLDMAVVPVLVLEQDIEDRRFSVALNIYREMYDLPVDELFRAAYENGKKDCLVEGLEFSAEELGYEMYTMSNGHNFAMLDWGELGALAGELHNEVLFILPASIYEFIIIPEDNVHDVTELQDFARNIAKSLDFEEAVLSEHVYRYSRKKDDMELFG